MKLPELKVWVAAVALSGALPFLSAAQEAGSRLQTPNKASVIAPRSQRLFPGQNFKFILRFDRPPHGYDAGSRVNYKFVLVSPALPETQPDGRLHESSQWTDLVNDDPEYPLTLHVTYSMLPGTWRLTEVAVVGGAQHPIPIQENVTFEVNEPPPPRASVSWGKSQTLEDGESFDFVIHLETVPEGYDAGEIRYRFERIKSDSQRAQPFRYGDLEVYEGRADLINGQSTYKLSVSVYQGGGAGPYGRYLSIGKWRLVEVTLGQVVKQPVLIQDDVTFEVHAPIIVLHVQAPASVRAGQRFAFKVSVDRYPKDINCLTTLSVNLSRRSPGGQPGPSDPLVEVPSRLLAPEQPSYEMSVPLASDLPGGQWQGELQLAVRSRYVSHMDLCRPVDFEGDHRFEFNVEPAGYLVTPTSVAVTVNPSQIQLLRAEADRLRGKAQHIREQLTSKDPAANQVLLQKSLQEAVADLDKTEETYKERGVGSSSARAVARAVNAFFDDIRFDYRDALEALADQSAQGSRGGARLVDASAVLGGPSALLNRASEKAIASVLHNATAYYVAASSGTLTLNLDVYSDPKGATVSYKQRTDPDFTTVDPTTDCRIPGLYRAGYLIRLQKPGYVEQKLPFNGADSDSTSIHATLVRKGRK